MLRTVNESKKVPENCFFHVEEKQNNENLINNINNSKKEKLHFI